MGRALFFLAFSASVCSVQQLLGRDPFLRGEKLALHQFLEPNLEGVLINLFIVQQIGERLDTAVRRVLVNRQVGGFLGLSIGQIAEQIVQVGVSGGPVPVSYCRTMVPSRRG